MIFDEAHNVLDAVGQMHSINVNYSEIEGMSKILSLYLDRYESRLKPQNSLYIRQINVLFKNTCDRQIDTFCLVAVLHCLCCFPFKVTHCLGCQSYSQSAMYPGLPEGLE